jgi:hypothetical protein
MPKIVYIFFVIFSREFASSRVRGFASSRVEFAGGVRGFAGSRVEFASSRVRGWRSKLCRLPRNSADLHADARTR